MRRSMEVFVTSKPFSPCLRISFKTCPVTHWTFITAESCDRLLTSFRLITQVLILLWFFFCMLKLTYTFESQWLWVILYWKLMLILIYWASTVCWNNTNSKIFFWSLSFTRTNFFRLVLIASMEHRRNMTFLKELKGTLLINVLIQVNLMWDT
jgi:hypothetical protein